MRLSVYDHFLELVLEALENRLRVLLEALDLEFVVLDHVVLQLQDFLLLLELLLHADRVEVLVLVDLLTRRRVDEGLVILVEDDSLVQVPGLDLLLHFPVLLLDVPDLVGDGEGRWGRMINN